MTAGNEAIPSSTIPWALENLPPYRPVARKLMSLTARNESLQQIEAVMRTDAAFTAQVLRLANSAYFGLRAQTSSVLQAVAILGLDRIKALATTLAMRTFLTSGKVPETLHRCWTHNLATALLCERLARFAHLDSDTCYTAGLLHDVGRLALVSAHPGEYERILDSQPEDAAELRLRERSAFDIDHCDAGRWILEHWGFPEDLRDVVWLHESRPEPGAGGLLPVVYAGWQMADLIGFSVVRKPVAGNSARRDIAGEIVQALGIRSLPGNLDELFEGIAMKVNAIECSLI